MHIDWRNEKISKFNVPGGPGANRVGVWWCDLDMLGRLWVTPCLVGPEWLNLGVWDLAWMMNNIALNTIKWYCESHTTRVITYVSFWASPVQCWPAAFYLRVAAQLHPLVLGWTAPVWTLRHSRAPILLSSASFPACRSSHSHSLVYSGHKKYLTLQLFRNAWMSLH